MKKLLLSAAFALALALPSFGQFSIQKVVFEEFTGAWCQYCADGAYRAEMMDGNFQDALMIGVHVGDAMDITEGADTMNAFYSPAFPQALFNRGGALVSRGAWSSTMSSALQGAGVVTVSFDTVGYDMATRTLTTRVRALFTGPATGDFRMNLAITEKEVTGTGSGYDQVNADNSTPGHPYQGAGNPIQGFVHRHVARDYLSGTWGQGGLFPGTVNFGTVSTYTYTYVLPANWDETKIELVAFLSNHEGDLVTQRTILNGEEFDLSALTVGRAEPNTSNFQLEILGNPVQDRCKVLFTTEEAGNFKLEVLNMLGQQVAVLGEGFQSEGIHTLYWHGTNAAGTPVDNGMYLVRLVTEGGQSISKRVLVAR